MSAPTAGRECVFAWRDGTTLVATEWAVGPWSAGALQGSATGGLLARAVERLAGDAGMGVGRLGFDMWRPVPRGRTEVDTEILRDGRRAKTVRASLCVDGTEVVRCTALLLRLGEDADLVPRPAATAVPGPDEGQTIPEPIRRWSPFFTGVDTRVIRGALGVPVPAAVWFRLERALVEGEENTPLVQAVSAADLTSGISAITDLRRVSFVNPDLTIHFWRPPRGEWILVDAETTPGEHGIGLAHAVLGDREGPFGRCAMALLFERVPG